MKNATNITSDDIKKVLSMSKEEIEKKLSSLDLKTIRGLSGNLNGDEIKKRLNSKSPEDISKLINMLGSINPALLKKIKDAIK